jgi:hypothetical protein
MLSQMTAQEVESLATAREVNRPGLLRMQLEPEPRKHKAHAPSGFLDLRLRAAHHDEVIGIAN